MFGVKLKTQERHLTAFGVELKTQSAPANSLNVVKVQVTADSVFSVKLKGGCPVLGVNDHSQFSLRSLFSFG